jgi:hypothetical protein
VVVGEKGRWVARRVRRDGRAIVMELRMEDGLLGVDAYFHAVSDVGMVVWEVLRALGCLEERWWFSFGGGLGSAWV